MRVEVAERKGENRSGHASLTRYQAFSFGPSTHSGSAYQCRGIHYAEMHAEPFLVPVPDEVILEERWATGEWFRSGIVWRLDKGRVFYFRPGHGTYPMFKEKPVLQLLENAIRWLASKPS